MLTEGAGAESIPNLEIEANDVQCSHASTVGPIDDDQLYYLESRGIPPEDAERLIVLGFFDDVFDRLPVRALAGASAPRRCIEKLEHLHGRGDERRRALCARRRRRARHRRAASTSTATGSCVVRIGDDLYAIGDRCSHADYSLSEGDVWADEREIECPKHGSTFSLLTGEPQTLPATQPVPSTTVRVDGDDVMVVAAVTREHCCDRGPARVGRRASRSCAASTSRCARARCTR